MKKLILLLPFLFAVACGDVYAQGIPFKPQTDTFQVGKDGSAGDKTVIFNTGDGASNPALTVDGALKTFDLNKALGITGDLDATGAGSVGGDFTVGGNNLNVGDGAEVDQFLNFNVSGGQAVGFKYDAATGEVLQKKKAGDAYKKLGTGSGGGGGSNFNNGFSEDENPNAEDGTTGWTASAGTFAVDALDPIEGDQSFIWTPAAQNNTLTSSVLDFDKDVFRGRACQAQIDAIGGDENLTVQVIDGNNAIVAEKVYSAQTIAAPFSVYFRCPTQAQITADAQKGNLRLRIVNAGAAASPLIKWDKSYAGTLIGLSESTLPDGFSAQVSSTGVVSRENVDWINGNCVFTGSTAACTYNETFIEPLNCVSTSAANRINQIASSTVTGFSVITLDGSLAAGGAQPFSVSCQKSGADAKQSVQVFTSIPKVAENVNEFSANVDGLVSPSTVTGENTNWIDGNCNRIGTGDYTCPFVPGTFSQKPNCQVSRTNGGNNINCMLRNTTSSTQAAVSCIIMNTNAASNEQFSLSCQKAESDYKLPTVQPIVLRENAIFFEGETDSLIGGYASFGGASDGVECTASPCTKYRDFGNLADGMIVTRSAAGNYLLSISGLKPSSPFSCYGSAGDPNAIRALAFRATDLISDVNGDASVILRTTVEGTATDRYLSLSCIGPKPL